jgi:hypothetical protein
LLLQAPLLGSLGSLPADGELVDVAEGGVFADFDEAYTWVLQEGSDEFGSFFEGEAFFVGEVDGGEDAAAKDIDVEVKEDCGGWRDHGENLLGGLMGADAADFGEGERGWAGWVRL